MGDGGWGNPPPTRAIVGLSRGYCGAIVGLLWGNPHPTRAIVGLSRGYCGAIERFIIYLD